MFFELAACWGCWEYLLQHFVENLEGSISERDKLWTRA